jgi:hypothetical protein
MWGTVRQCAYGLATSPFDLDTNHARLVRNKYEDIDGAVAGLSEVPSTDWSRGDCDHGLFPGKPDPAQICLRRGADPAMMYELHNMA